MAKATQESRHIALATPLGDDVLLPQTFTGTEELGRLFSYELELLSDNQSIAFKDIIGQNVTIRLQRRDGETRYFNGFVSRFTQVASSPRYARYKATVVPWLWFLTRSADCRIFQDMSIPDIIKQVCSDHGFTDIKDDTSSTYNPWPNCVQYRESAFDFISRLMEGEGIYYYFSHEDGKHTLHLCDSAATHQPISGDETIALREPDVSMGLDAIWDWTMEQELQPGVISHGDFDFTATTKDLNAKAVTNLEVPNSKLEVYDYPGDYETADEGEAYSKIRLQELESHACGITAVTSARGLTPGATFTLSEHPREDQNKKYLVTSVEYDFSNDNLDQSGEFKEGDEDASQANLIRFSAIDAAEQFRPECETECPTIQGPQTAIVVGPSGEEIYTDEHGRVKVMFHWDRYCKADENSSCWIRVAQVWGGKQWGAIYTPRIGQEVIVEFLEGDPDKPLITGRVYNGTNKPPYPLPDMATISTLKSSSSKGGAGFNEIRFEDKKDEEQLFIHGQKNMDVRVKNDAFEWIGNDRHLVIVNDQLEHVKNNRSEIVDQDHKEKIGKDRHLKVVGKEAKEVGDSLSLTVKGDVIEVFKAKHSEETTGDYYLKADNICIEGLTNITIKVGQTSIALESDGISIETQGEIKVKSMKDTSFKSDTGNFKAEATQNVELKGTAGAKLEGTAQVEVKGATATLKGDAMTTIKGGMVMIN